VLLAGLPQELANLALTDADVLALEAQQQLLRCPLQLQLGCAGEHLRQPHVRLQPRDLRGIDERRHHAVDEICHRALLDGVLAERRQHVRDVLHEGPVRPDDEDARPRELLAEGVEEPGGAVEADGGLAGAGAALDHERPVGIVGDQPVLVALDRRDDVAHVHIAAALQLLQEEVAHAGAVERGPVEALVGDVEQAPALRTEAAAQRHPLRVGRSRRVEGSCRGRLPAHDDLLLLLPVHPAPAYVERALDALEVESAEEEAALGVLEGGETPRAPRVQRGLRDLAVGRVARPRDDVAHALEAAVGTVDVRLLGGKLRMAHPPNLAVL